MQWRIGVLGIGLAIALVVGGIADQPPASFSQDFPAQPAVSDWVSETVPPSQVLPTTGIVPGGVEVGEIVPQVGSAGDLIGFNGFDGSGSQTITLVHTRKMQIAVYHIDRSGQIRLVSSRPIDDDFSLSLNVTKPFPGEIRMLGGQVK